MAWVETQSPSFAARHEEEDAAAAADLLHDLESFRTELAELFPRTPGDVTVVIHGGPFSLALAQPWLPLARFAVAPAGRRYMAGWFSRRELHVLAPGALEERASAVEGSREALMLSPLHEYAHMAIGANNVALPPPFDPGSFRRYLRWAWLCEGAATYLAGQSQHLAAAVTRRLHEGGRPQFPPSARDAPLLGGSVFDMLEEARGARACAELAMSRLDPSGPRRMLERAFELPFVELEMLWRDRIGGAGGRVRRRRGHLHEADPEP
jgi:hypothetical protein